MIENASYVQSLSHNIKSVANNKTSENTKQKKQ